MRASVPANTTGDPDYLYKVCWPDYFETQRKDLWYYERLWSVLLRQLEKRHPYRSLIEFGSGPGFLLQLAGRRGWDAVGEEPSQVARDHARSLGVTSADLGFWLCQQSAAIATEVLEHVDNPYQELQKWREAIIPGGFLSLSAPNDNNPLQRLFGKWISPDRKTPKHWIHPTHKSYFNPRSLKQLVESCGFEVVWQRTSFPVEILLAIPFLPRKWSWKLSRLWPAPPFLWRLGLGRHCLLVAARRD